MLNIDSKRVVVCRTGTAMQLYSWSKNKSRITTIAIHIGIVPFMKYFVKIVIVAVSRHIHNILMHMSVIIIILSSTLHCHVVPFLCLTVMLLRITLDEKEKRKTEKE